MPTGAVTKVPLTGGSRVTLASGQTARTGIAVEATSAYWADSGNAPGSGAVLKFPSLAEAPPRSPRIRWRSRPARRRGFRRLPRRTRPRRPGQLDARRSWASTPSTARSGSAGTATSRRRGVLPETLSHALTGPWSACSSPPSEGERQLGHARHWPPRRQPWPGCGRRCRRMRLRGRPTCCAPAPIGPSSSLARLLRQDRVLAVLASTALGCQPVLLSASTRQGDRRRGGFLRLHAPRRGPGGRHVACWTPQT